VLNERGIVHSDLHSGNVMVSKTVNDVCVYLFSGNEEYAFYTYGCTPVIIDFGHAYLEGDSMMRTTISLSQLGYTPHRFNPLSDAMRVIRPLMGEDTELRKAINCVPLNSAGYFNGSLINVLDCICDLFPESYEIDDLVLELIAANIRLPLRRIRNPTDFVDAFMSLIRLKLHYYEIKNLLDNRVAMMRKQYTRRQIYIFRSKCMTAVWALNNIICDLFEDLDAEISSITSGCKIKNAREALRMMPREKVTYKAGMQVCLYDAELMKTYLIKINSKEEARQLNLGITTFKEYL
jgi:hypothetical protein